MAQEADDPRTNASDDRLVEILDQLTSALQSGGRLDSDTMRDQACALAGDGAELVSTIRDLELAALDWESAAGEASEAEQPTVDFAPDSDHPTPASAAISTIGRFEVLGCIGAGGMGDVYRARDPQLGRQVAIKIPRLDLTREGAASDCQRFKREAKAAANVRHNHVCPIHDVGEHNGLPYVVMAYVPGSNLARRLKGGRFENVREAVEIVRQSAEGLAAVHAQGIVHRDVKPGNILLDENCQAVLTDFGLARATADEEHLTGSGTLIGTPAYMAPEQARGDADRVGPASDIYSLGVVLYQLLTGKLPFTGDMLTVLRKISDETPPRAADLRPDMDPALASIIETAMAREPEHRHASAKALAAALQQWLDGQATVVAATTRANRAPPPNAWRGWSTSTIWVCGSVVMAVLVFGLMLPMMSPRDFHLADNRPTRGNTFGEVRHKWSSEKANATEKAPDLPPVEPPSKAAVAQKGKTQIPPTAAPTPKGHHFPVVPPVLLQQRPEFFLNGEKLVALQTERDAYRSKLGLTKEAPDAAGAPAKVAAPTGNVLVGSLEIRVWGRGHVETPIEQALPVVNGDKVRIEAIVNQPAHLFVLWIDADGKIQFVKKDGVVENFPLTPAAPTPATEPTTFLAAPAREPGKPLHGYAIEGAAGTETALLLARKMPLAEGQSLGALLAKCMPKEWPKTVGPDVVWLDIDPASKHARYQLPHQRRTRGLDPVAKTIDDPVIEFLNKLQPHFDLIQAVRFSHAAK